MPSETGFFEAFYASSVQHPILLWVAALFAMGYCATIRGLDPGVRRYSLGLGLLSLLDAWLTSDHIPGVGSLPASVAGLVPLFFVLAGDLRFLLVVTGAEPSGRLGWNGRNVAQAVGLTLVVPIFTQVVLSVLPAEMDQPRVMFLIYEMSFVVLTLMLLVAHPTLRTLPWARRVGRFVAGYYSLWALADAIILGLHSDLGFALRVVPNVLYYGGLIAMIAANSAQTGRRQDVDG